MKTQHTIVMSVLLACQIAGCDAETESSAQSSQPAGKADDAGHAEAPAGLATHTLATAACISSFNDGLVAAQSDCDEGEMFDGLCNISQERLTDLTRDRIECLEASNDDALRLIEYDSDASLLELAANWRAAAAATADADENVPLVRAQVEAYSESSLASIIGAYGALDGANVPFLRGEFNYSGCRDAYWDAQDEIAGADLVELELMIASEQAELDLADCIRAIGDEVAQERDLGDLHTNFQAQGASLCHALGVTSSVASWSVRIAQCEADTAEIIADLFFGGVGV